LAERNDDSEE
jgi:ribosome recycling factor